MHPRRRVVRVAPKSANERFCLAGNTRRLSPKHNLLWVRRNAVTPSFMYLHAISFLWHVLYLKYVPICANTVAS